MKVLYCTRNISDYGEDTIFDGLCRVLGSQNVLEYPQKDSLHGKPSKAHGNYPCMFDYPITHTEAEITAMLADGAFDMLLVCCGATYDFRMGGRGTRHDKFYKLLEARSQNIPTYLIDQGDLEDINTELWDELHARLYFKREYKGRHQRNKRIIPLSMCYSEKYIPTSIDGERIIPLFWAGGQNSYRQDCLKVALEFDRHIYGANMAQPVYAAQLLQTRIGLSLKGFGWDTVRYYEVPAHGALLLAQRPKIFIANPFIDGETAVLFDTPEQLRGLLHFLIRHPDYVDKVRLQGHAWLKKYHTSTMRATQLLERIAADGR